MSELRIVKKKLNEALDAVQKIEKNHAAMIESLGHNTHDTVLLELNRCMAAEQKKLEVLSQKIADLLESAVQMERLEMEA